MLSRLLSTAFNQQRGARLGSGFWSFEAHLMWFTFVTARLFHSLSIQPRLAATLLSSCSVANSPTRRVGLSPTLRPASLAQALFASVRILRSACGPEQATEGNEEDEESK